MSWSSAPRSFRAAPPRLIAPKSPRCAARRKKGVCGADEPVDSELFAVGAELLEIGDDVVDVGLRGEPGERHLGAGDLAARVLEIFLQRRLIPGEAGILVGVAVGIAGKRPR